MGPRVVDAEITRLAEFLAARLEQLPDDKRIDALNSVRKILSAVSPMRGQPVDCVTWEPAEIVRGNDYNPNTVAPPEMRLLELSILQDGYTQPIVAWAVGDGYEVVDGFHRHRVGRACSDVRTAVMGRLPLAIINQERADRGDRIAATIRHNRARGRHVVDSMSEIVIELKRRNWSDAKIGRQLGMEPDEVLRLAQIAGLAEMFADRDFSQAWDDA